MPVIMNSPVTYSGPSFTEAPRSKKKNAGLTTLLSDFSWDMVLICAMAVSLSLLNLYEVTGILVVVRLIIALPVLFLFPGYALSVSLFVHRNDLMWLERLGLSIILSMAQLIFIGLFLYFMNQPIHQRNLLLGLVLMLGLLAVASIWRRAGVPGREYFAPWRGWHVPALNNQWDEIFMVAVVGLVSLGLSAVVYGLITAVPTEHYTEFSVLAPHSGKADLPLKVVASDVSELVVTIKNQEHQSQAYELRLSSDNIYTSTIAIGTLNHGSAWTGLVQLPITADVPVHQLKLELFLSNQTAPYRELHLWIDRAAGQP